jgi:hypothetical protein
MLLADAALLLGGSGCNGRATTSHWLLRRTSPACTYCNTIGKNLPGAVVLFVISDLYLNNTRWKMMMYVCMWLVLMW